MGSGRACAEVSNQNLIHGLTFFEILETLDPFSIIIGSPSVYLLNTVEFKCAFKRAIFRSREVLRVNMLRVRRRSILIRYRIFSYIFDYIYYFSIENVLFLNLFSIRLQHDYQ